jgi:hypothetical protein
MSNSSNEDLVRAPSSKRANTSTPNLLNLANAPVASAPESNDISGIMPFVHDLDIDMAIVCVCCKPGDTLYSYHAFAQIEQCGVADMRFNFQIKHPVCVQFCL